jgi:hypothetical protein
MPIVTAEWTGAGWMVALPGGIARFARDERDVELLVRDNACGSVIRYRFTPAAAMPIRQPTPSGASERALPAT